MMKFFFSKNENGQEVAEEIVMVKETLDVPGVVTEQEEIASVISLALNMYLNSIEEEERTLETVQKIMKMHSSWNGRNLGLRQLPLYIPNQKR